MRKCIVAVYKKSQRMNLAKDYNIIEKLGFTQIKNMNNEIHDSEYKFIYFS